MTFTSYASSSAGNLYLVRDAKTAVLLECGVTFKKIQKYLGFDFGGICGCLLSHEHAHARVDRGDVSGCSIGFEIARQEEWWDENGVYRTRILEVYPLYEVSPCTFPAYTATNISARAADVLADTRARYEAAKRQRLEQWRSQMRARLKGE